MLPLKAVKQHHLYCLGNILNAHQRLVEQVSLTNSPKRRLNSEIIKSFSLTRQTIVPLSIFYLHRAVPLHCRRERLGTASLSSLQIPCLCIAQ